MLVKSVFAVVAMFSVASAWEIMLYEPGSGGDANNCASGGTTVSGSGSTCVGSLNSRNIQSAQVLDDSDACAFEMWSGDACSGNQNNNQNGACFNALHPIGSVRVLC